MIRAERRELLSDPQLGPVPQPGEVLRQRGLGSGEHAAEGRLEAGTLGVLVVHRTALVLERRDGRRPLVGHDDRVPVVEHRGHDRDRGQDPGHRDVPVEEAELGGAQQLRIDLPLGPHHRQPGDRGRLLDRREPVGRPADHEQRGIGQPPDPLHHHDRVDPAAERDERALADGGLPRARSMAAGATRFDTEGGEVQVVAVGELAEALQVELAEEGQLGAAQRGRAKVDDRRRRGLVIGHPGQQEHQASGRPGRFGVPPRAGRQRDAFGELPPVQRVPAAQHPPLRVRGPRPVPEHPPASQWVRHPTGKRHYGVTSIGCWRRATRARRPHGRAARSLKK